MCYTLDDAGDNIKVINPNADVKEGGVWYMKKIIKNAMAGVAMALVLAGTGVSVQAAQEEIPSIPNEPISEEEWVVAPQGDNSTTSDSYSFEDYGTILTENNDGFTVEANIKSKYPEQEYKYCMYAYNYTKGSRELVAGWQDSTVFEWKPDANDDYEIVIYAGIYGPLTGIPEDPQGWGYNIYGIFETEVKRPQMGKKVLEDCVAETSEGLLFGCTSNLTSEDSNYYTTCYIYSDAKKAWIAKARYQASSCAWFKVSSLEKGNYMMYNCTEEKQADGTFRKLSSKYFLFSV